MEGCFNLILSQNQQRWWHFLYFFFRGFSGATGFFLTLSKTCLGTPTADTHNNSFPSSASVLKADFCINSLIQGHPQFGSCRLFGNWVILHLITLKSELRLEVQKVRDYLRLLAGSSLIHITLGHIHFRKIPGNLAKTDIQKMSLIALLHIFCLT